MTSRVTAKEAMRFLQNFGAKHLIVFPPGRMKPGQDVEAGFRSMCTGFNRIGEAANAMGFQAALHNHLDEMVQVLLEDLAIAILFVRLSSAVGSRAATVLVACLFAAGHIPAMVSRSVGLCSRSM